MMLETVSLLPAVALAPVHVPPLALQAVGEFVVVQDSRVEPLYATAVGLAERLTVGAQT